MDKNISTLVRLLAQQAAKAYMQSPELVNTFYSLDKSKRPVLVDMARTIAGRKS